MTISLPARINDNVAGFGSLFRIKREIDRCPEPIELDFSLCQFLGHNAVAFLGGLILTRTALHQNPIVVNWHSVGEKVHKDLALNGFAEVFGGEFVSETGNTVRFRADTSTTDLQSYLLEEWLGRGWVHLSRRLRNDIAGKTWEIYSNSLEHSKSPAGVFTCGQHYPDKHRLKLCVIDFGVGIPANAREYFTEQVGLPGAGEIDDAAYLRWAFRRGATTKPNVSRGLGLDLLRDFVRINQGSMAIISNFGRVHIDKHKDDFTDAHQFFGGTIVNIDFTCDENIYHYADEDINDPLF